MTVACHLTLSTSLERGTRPQTEAPTLPRDYPLRTRALFPSQVLRNQVAGAMHKGPQALRELFELFDVDADDRISRSALRDVLVDFGLALTDRQARPGRAAASVAPAAALGDMRWVSLTVSIMARLGSDGSLKL